MVLPEKGSITGARRSLRRVVAESNAWGMWRQRGGASYDRRAARSAAQESARDAQHTYMYLALVFSLSRATIGPGNTCLTYMYSVQHCKLRRAAICGAFDELLRGCSIAACDGAVRWHCKTQKTCPGGYGGQLVLAWQLGG